MQLVVVVDGACVALGVVPHAAAHEERRASHAAARSVPLHPWSVAAAAWPVVPARSSAAADAPRSRLGEGRHEDRGGE